MIERRALRIASLVVAVIASASLGCETQQPADGSDLAMNSARTSASAAIASARAAPVSANLAPPDKPLPTAGPPGPAYFAVQGKGLAVLAVDEVEGQAQLSLVEGSPKKDLEDLQRAASGAIYVKAPEGIMKLTAGKLETVAKLDGAKQGNVHHFALTADEKTIWAASLKGLSRWDGSAWTTEPLESIAKGMRVVQGLAVDGDGQLWVAGTSRLHVKAAAEWKDVTPPSDRKQFFKGLESGPKGEVIALASGALYRCKGAAVELIDVGLPGRLLSQHLSVSDNGIVAFKTGQREVGRTQPGAVMWLYSAKKDQVLADGIQHVAVDERGRVWVVSRAGVSIVGPGEERVDWATGTVDLLRGPIRGLVVSGAGPKLPAAGAVKRGGLEGKIMLSGAPLAGADIELCPSPEIVFKKSPCADASIRLTGKTDAKGVFNIADAPLGIYGIAAKVGEDWRVQGASPNQQMKEGEIFDLGTVTLANKK